MIQCDEHLPEIQKSILENFERFLGSRSQWNMRFKIEYDGRISRKSSIKISQSSRHCVIVFVFRKGKTGNLGVPSSDHYTVSWWKT